MLRVNVSIYSRDFVSVLWAILKIDDVDPSLIQDIHRKIKFGRGMHADPYPLYQQCMDRIRAGTYPVRPRP